MVLKPLGSKEVFMLLTEMTENTSTITFKVWNPSQTKHPSFRQMMTNTHTERFVTFSAKKTAGSPDSLNWEGDHQYHQVIIPSRLPRRNTGLYASSSPARMMALLKMQLKWPKKSKNWRPWTLSSTKRSKSWRSKWSSWSPTSVT